MTTRRALYVDQARTITDDPDPIRQERRTPPDYAAGGLAGLLARLAPQFDGEGVVVVGGQAVGALGLPTRRDDDDQGAALIADLTRAGWNCSRVGDWSKVWAAGRPTVHVCNLALLDRRDPEAFPLWDDDLLDLVARLRMWHDLTGSAWRGSPGWAGLAIMSRLDDQRVASARSAAPTTWKLTKAADGPDAGFEDDYRRKQWSRVPGDDEPRAYALCFDAIRAYMAAAGTLEVSPWQLKHTGRIRFDKRRAGWWQVELAPWQVPHMPDPAGYVPTVDATDPRRLVRWLTTPRVALLEELTDQGVYGGVRIVDSWTGPARKYPLKPYAERMRDAFNLLDHRTGQPLAGMVAADVPVLRSAVKIVGHKTWGATDSPANWVHRSHWWHSIVAANGANMWRRCWRVGQMCGRWPLFIEVDAVWYGADTDDYAEAARSLQYVEGGQTKGILLDPTGSKLGRFTGKGRKRMKVRTP